MRPLPRGQTLFLASSRRRTRAASARLVETWICQFIPRLSSSHFRSCTTCFREVTAPAAKHQTAFPRNTPRYTSDQRRLVHYQLHVPYARPYDRRNGRYLLKGITTRHWLKCFFGVYTKYNILCNTCQKKRC